jgi:hypothetical protein
MKVLEAQAAVLTNYEVLQHLTQQKERYKQRKRRGPPNLETVVREVRQTNRRHEMKPVGPLSRSLTDTRTLTLAPSSSSNISSHIPTL